MSARQRFEAIIRILPCPISGNSAHLRSAAMIEETARTARHGRDRQTLDDQPVLLAWSEAGARRTHDKIGEGYKVPGGEVTGDDSDARRTRAGSPPHTA